MRFMADFALISKKGCALKSDEFTFASYDPAPAARRVAHLPPLMRATVLFSDGRRRKRKTKRAEDLAEGAERGLKPWLKRVEKRTPGIRHPNMRARHESEEARVGKTERGHYPPTPFYFLILRP